MGRVVLILTAMAGIGLVGGVAFVLGAIHGELGAYHRQYERERDLLSPALAADRAFARIKIHKYSDGGAWLSGEVDTTDDLGRLKGMVTRLVGEARAANAVAAVSIKR